MVWCVRRRIRRRTCTRPDHAMSANGVAALDEPHWPCAAKSPDRQGKAGAIHTALRLTNVIPGWCRLEKRRSNWFLRVVQHTSCRCTICSHLLQLLLFVMFLHRLIAYFISHLLIPSPQQVGRLKREFEIPKSLSTLPSQHPNPLSDNS